MATLYLLLHKKSPNLSGRHRGLYWQEGAAVFGDPKERRRQQRRVGGEAVDVNIPLECTCGKTRICSNLTLACDNEEDSEGAEDSESPEDSDPAEVDFSLPKEDPPYAEQLSFLGRAKEGGIFDWYEYTGGSRAKDEVAQAYAHLKEILE